MNYFHLANNVLSLGIEMRQFFEEMAYMIDMGKRKVSPVCHKSKLDSECLARLAPKSKTAAKYLEADMHLYNACTSYMELLSSGRLDDALENKLIVSKLFLALSNSEIVRALPLRDGLLRLIRNVMQREPKNEEACYCWAKMQVNETLAISFLEHCCALFPTNANFWELRGSMCCFEAMWQEGLDCFNKAYELSGQYDLLYSISVAKEHLAGGDSPNILRQAIEGYQSFLKECEEDHRKAPKGKTKCKMEEASMEAYLHRGADRW